MAVWWLEVAAVLNWWRLVFGMGMAAGLLARRRVHMSGIGSDWSRLRDFFVVNVLWRGRLAVLMRWTAWVSASRTCGRAGSEARLFWAWRYPVREVVKTSQIPFRGGHVAR